MTAIKKEMVVRLTFKNGGTQIVEFEDVDNDFIECVGGAFKRQTTMKYKFNNGYVCVNMFDVSAIVITVKNEIHQDETVSRNT